MSNGSIQIEKNLGMKHNVTIRVIDEPTGRIVSEHVGHNTATNTLITGIGHYLLGEGILGGGEIIREWLPQYISLGTMGLGSQEQDANGLPAGIGGTSGTEEDRFIDYILHTPGYGSDGYDTSLMNGRKYTGLGPMFQDRTSGSTIDCELISDTFPRSRITYRDIVPEYKSEIPKTIDVIFSAMISTGALAQFRESGKDYIFISEVGLWSRQTWQGPSGENGMLAGYRIIPPDEENWDMSDPENRLILKKNIIRIGVNQVAQVIWKIQLGSMEQLGGIGKLYPQAPREGYMKWKVEM